MCTWRIIFSTYAFLEVIDMVVNESNNNLNDIENIIDSLDKKEYDYIGGGYWTDSNHVIYRKVEYSNNEPVAFIDVYKLPRGHGYGMIILAVKKSSRGTGIAKKLVNSAINGCKNKDIKGFRIKIDSDNNASINMAKSLGFSEIKSDNKNEKAFIYNYINTESAIINEAYNGPIMNYKDQKEWEILNKKLENMEYGILMPGYEVILPLNRRNYNTTKEDWDKYWRLASPEQFVKQNGGVCWDYVAYKAAWLDNKKIKYNAYYMEFNNGATHTIITTPIFHNSSKIEYWENSIDYLNGSYYSDTLYEVLELIVDTIGKKEKINLKIKSLYEYYPNEEMYGLNSAEYIAYIKKYGKKMNPSQLESVINENIIFNKKDLEYRLNDFINGNVNVALIVGFLFFFKSTLGKELAKKVNADYCELDKLIFNWDYSDKDLDKLGELSYKFFKGIGKKYRVSESFARNTPTEGDYELPLINDFMNFAISYTKNSNKKFVIEGLWPILFNHSPDTYKDWCVIIKGTSYLISAYRGTIRDMRDENSSGSVNFIKTLKKYINKSDFDMSKTIDKWYKYFNNYQIQESADIINESSKNIINCYRYEYDGVGIYEAFRLNISEKVWKDFNVIIYNFFKRFIFLVIEIS